MAPVAAIIDPEEIEKIVNEKMEEFKEGLRAQKNNVKDMEDDIYEIKKELK